jgi:flagellar assembly protein FliH
LSRLLVRDGLKEGDIRLYNHDNLNGSSTARPADRSNDNAWQVAFESVDFVEFAPYLLLLAAQEKAQALLADAGSAAEQSRQEAWRHGCEQGHAAAKEDILPALVAFADAGQSLIIFEEQLVSRCAPQIVRLALEIAEKMVGKALAEDPAIIVSVLERAKQQVLEAKQIRIRLHPDDFKFISEIRPEVIKMGQAEGRLIEVLPTEEISRGGCRLETEIGVVDATMPTQIEEIRRQLLDDGSQNSLAQSLGTKL